MLGVCIATGLKGLSETLMQFNKRPGIKIVAVTQHFHKYTVIYDDSEWRKAGYPLQRDEGKGGGNI